MQDIIINVIEKFGYIGISFLIMIENIFPPIPSEVILTFGGFSTTFTSLGVVGVIIASTIGAVVGAIILYYIGTILNEERLKKIVSGKVGKILHLNMNDINSANRWFDNKGYLTVFFCRCIPIVRSLISIPAGMANMKFIPFLLLTSLGSLIWNTVLTLLGRGAGEAWPKIVEIINNYSKITLVVLVLLFIVGVYFFIRSRKKRK